MPLFRYQALNVDGRQRAGTLEADSLEHAKDALREKEILVTAIMPAPAQHHKAQTPHPAFLLHFTRELAQLLMAGLPLYESLKTIAEKYRKDRVHFFLLHCIDQLKQGNRFSSALCAFSSVFDNIYLAMIEAGEASGDLPQIVARLSRTLEKKHTVRKQMITACVYPAFLGCFSFLVFMGLLLWVIPAMEDLFDGRELHGMTAAVFYTSRCVREHVVLETSSMMICGIGIWVGLRSRAGKKRVIQWLFQLPFVRTFALHTAIARFFRTGGMLLSHGIPLVEALRLARGSIYHPAMDMLISSAENNILKGASFYREVRQSALLPTLVLRLLAIAEETGRMEKTFDDIANIYEQEVEKSLSQLMHLLQPILLLLLGAVVGLVVVSVLLPLTDISSFAGEL